MAKLSIVAGATSQSVNIFVQDSSSTAGAGLSGLAFNTSSLIAYYTFAGANATATAITLATLAAVNSAFSSGGFKEIDATNMKGLYRLDLPNAALATAHGRVVTVQLGGATNMAPVVLEIELTGIDNQDGVRAGMTALPNAAANAAGGLPVSTAGGLDLDEMNVDIEAIQTSTAGLTFTGAGKVDASVRDWVGDTIPARNVTGVPKVDVVDWLGTAVTAATAGIPDTNVKNINNVSTASVTTINANQGTTQPVNFTGTGASALAKADTVDVAGAAVNALIAGRMDSNAQVVGTGAIVSGSFAANAIDSGALATTAANEIRDAVWAQAMTELAAVPGVTDTLLNALTWLFELSRNKVTQTATTQLLRNDADAATIGTSTVSDDGTTFIRGKFA